LTTGWGTIAIATIERAALSYTQYRPFYLDPCARVVTAQTRDPSEESVVRRVQMSSGVRSDATLPIESTHQALASPAHVSVPIASARSDICKTSFGFFGQNLSESDSFFLRVEARSLDLVTVGLEHDEIGSAFRLNQDVHNAVVHRVCTILPILA
jgi:hypothetical protein